ncbi:MAG: serine hydrolase [Candidatus Omnitrophota bacterium]
MNTTKPIIPKRIKVLFAVLFLWSVVWTPEVCARKSSGAKKKKSSKGVTAQSVYAVDYTNRRVLFSRNPRQTFFPASTTKLMTALVVLDQLDLNQQIKVSSKAVGVTPTRAGLTKGATYSVRDLLELLLAASANDAAVTLAEGVAGSEQDFVVLMNKKAKALGCKDSNFANASGLPNKKQVTTAYDLSIIVRAALSNSFVLETMKAKYVSATGSDDKKIKKKNHNKMLWKTKDPCVLGKTGYTIAARHCFAGIAYYDDHRVSFVILKSRKPWQDICRILGLKVDG